VPFSGIGLLFNPGLGCGSGGFDLLVAGHGHMRIVPLQYPSFSFKTVRHYFPGMVVAGSNGFFS
jgi:hypothetical protein